MGASTLCLGRTHGTHTPETLQSLSHGGSAGTAGHCHCAGTATLGAGAGGPLGPGAKMGSIKARNGMDLTKADYIKRRWQEYTEELYKKKKSL